MSDLETEASQGLPEGEPVAQPDTSTDAGTVQNAETQADAQPENQEEADKRPKEKPWFVSRIERERSEKEALAQRVRDLEARLNPPQQQETDEPQKRPIDPADIERLVEVRAQQKAYVDRFNADADAAYAKGKTEFPDFDDALGNFGKLHGGLPPALIEAALETGEAHRVLYQLGKDPAEAERILSLPPTRQAVALAKLATAKPPPVSKAPTPVSPVSGQARGGKDPSSMSMAEWVKWREQSRN